jgi:hypothetical protein
MNVIYSEKARQSSEGYALLQQATKYLEEELGKAVDRVRVEWDRQDDNNGHSSFILRLFDPPDSISRSFTLADLRATKDLQLELNWLWDDLLQEKIERQLRELQQVASQEK